MVQFYKKKKTWNRIEKSWHNDAHETIIDWTLRYIYIQNWPMDYAFNIAHRLKIDKNDKPWISEEGFMCGSRKKKCIEVLFQWRKESSIQCPCSAFANHIMTCKTSAPKEFSKEKLIKYFKSNLTMLPTPYTQTETNR